MSKKGVLKWNAEQLTSIKRDLLFFDEFYYDPLMLELKMTLLDNASKLCGYDNKVIDNIFANVDFLQGKKLLHEFKLTDFKKGKIKFPNLSDSDCQELITASHDYDLFHQSFIKKYNSVLKVLENDYGSGFLEFINLLPAFDIVADYHVRLSTIILRKSIPNISLTPIIDNLNGIEEGKESKVIRLTIEKLPVPNSLVPLDEVIDFRNDTNNRRKYLGLINWLNELSRSDYTPGEIKDKMEYYISEFEYGMGLAKKDYSNSKFELILQIPFNMAESIIKIKWSQILKPLFDFRRNKIKLLKEETKVKGSEIAYIVAASEKFD